MPYWCLVRSIVLRPLIAMRDDSFHIMPRFFLSGVKYLHDHGIIHQDVESPFALPCQFPNYRMNFSTHKTTSGLSPASNQCT